MQRVHGRVDDRAHEAVALGAGRAARAASSRRGVEELGRSRSSGGGSLSSGMQEEARAARALAEAHAAREHRDRHREDQRADDRRHPPEVVGVEPVERRAPGAGDAACRARDGGSPRASRLARRSRPCERQRDRAAEQVHQRRSGCGTPCGSARAGSRATISSSDARDRAGRRRRTRARSRRAATISTTLEHLRQEEDHAGDARAARAPSRAATSATPGTGSRPCGK